MPAPGYQSYAWTTQDWRTVKLAKGGQAVDYAERCGTDSTLPSERKRLCLPREVIERLLQSAEGTRILIAQARKKQRAAPGTSVPWHPTIKALWRELEERTVKDRRDNPVESASAFKPHSLERGEDPTTRDNPPPTDAKERYTTSHWGIEPTKVYEADIPGEPDDAEMTEMGKLIELWVRPRKRDRADALKINFPVNAGCHLAFTPDDRERLYCVLPPKWRKIVRDRLIQPGYDWYTLSDIAAAAGGRQSGFDLPDRDAQVLGYLTNVVYATWKKGDDDDQEGCEYIHRMGEEGGMEPYLAVDGDGHLWICGGTYSVPDDGITH